MENKIIDIKAESLPWQAKLMGIVFIVLALAVMVSHWWLSPLLAVVGVVLLLAYSGTTIDPVNKTFREYNSYLFFRTGSTEQYHAVEKLFINQAKVSQTMYTASTASSATFQHVQFNAYIKFDDGRKIFLAARKNKSELVTLLNKANALLAVEVVDYTSSHE